jgi:hypothetical protein
VVIPAFDIDRSKRFYSEQHIEGGVWADEPGGPWNTQ